MINTVGLKSNTTQLYFVLGEPSYVGSFTLYLRMALNLILTDFPTAMYTVRN